MNPRSMTLPARPGHAEFKVLRCQDRGLTAAFEMGEIADVRAADRFRTDPANDGSAGYLPAGDGRVPVYRLGDCFGAGSAAVAADEAGSVVVFRSPAGLWGVLVDQVSSMRRVPREKFHPLRDAPPELLLDAVRGVISVDEEPVLLLSGGRLRGGPADDPYPAAEWGHDEWAEPAPTANRATQLMLFSPGEPAGTGRPVVFGLSISQVREVVSLPQVVPLPGAPGHVLGLAVFKGRAVVVYDFARKLGVPPVADEARRRVLLVRIPGQRTPVAVVAHPQVRMLRLPAAHVPCRRCPFPDPFVVAALEFEGQTVVIPNVTALLSPE